METTIKALAHYLRSLALPTDWSWCFYMWPCLAWHAPFSWGLWVASYLFSSSHLLICWHTWTIKLIFWNNMWLYLTLDWCDSGNPGYASHGAQGWAPSCALEMPDLIPPSLFLSLPVTSLTCSRCSNLSQQPHCLHLSAYAGVVPLPRELPKHSSPLAVPLWEGEGEVTVWLVHHCLHCSSNAIRAWACTLSIQPWSAICQYPDPGSYMFLLLNLVQIFDRWTFIGRFIAPSLG